MDSSNANDAGEPPLNIDLKELGCLDDRFSTDSKFEAAPEPVCETCRTLLHQSWYFNEKLKLGDMNATSTISEMPDMQLRAKTLTDGGVTLKSEHRDRFTLFHETAVRDSDHDLGPDLRATPNRRGWSSFLSQSAIHPKNFRPGWLWLYTSGACPSSVACV
jgi:hypothetical protein